jgi:hypothetical protein
MHRKTISKETADAEAHLSEVVERAGDTVRITRRAAREM